MALNDIGRVPWSDSDIHKEFYNFVEIYKQAPIKDNTGGMKAPHAFATWFMLKKIKPKTIIESGVWKGQGTWLIEQACPKSQIICLDVNFKNIQYKSKNARYINRDFSLIDFSDVHKPDALCFFDDHQNALDRLLQMHWKGFKKAIFEDNYPPKRGDCYSIKKILSGTGFDPKLSSNGFISNVLSSIKLILNNTGFISKVVEPNDTHRLEFMEKILTYYEFPPIFKSKLTRWKDAWNDQEYPTKKPIFDESVHHQLKIESIFYTWICFVLFK